MNKDFNAEKIILAPVEIISTDELQKKIQPLLNWLKYQTGYKEKKNSETKINIISGMKFYGYKLKIDTTFVRREFEEKTRYTDKTICTEGNKLDTSCLWSTRRDLLVLPKAGTCTIPIEDTSSIKICNKCHEEGNVTCPECGGLKQVTCKSCDGAGSTREKVWVTCPQCHGKGTYYGKTCPTCKDGTSLIINAIQSKDGKFGNRAEGCGQIEEWRDITCSVCNGSGEVTCRQCEGKGYISCPTCHGSGHLEHLWVIQQKLIAGYRSDSAYRDTGFSFALPQTSITSSKDIELVYTWQSNSGKVDDDVTDVIQSDFAVSINEAIAKLNKTIESESQIILNQSVTLYRAAEYVKINYKYLSQQYSAWINTQNDLQIYEFLSDGFCAAWNRSKEKFIKNVNIFKRIFAKVNYLSAIPDDLSEANKVELADKLTNIFPPGAKSQNLFVLLSILIPGTHNLYIGYIKKGIIQILLLFLSIGILIAIETLPILYKFVENYANSNAIFKILAFFCIGLWGGFSYFWSLAEASFTKTDRKKIPMRKGKAVLLAKCIFITLCIGLTCAAGELASWYKSPEQKFMRAQKCTNSIKQTQMLDELASKNYTPSIMFYARLSASKLNLPKSFTLYSHAADLGNAEAWYKKGVYLEKGLGTTQNLTEAYNCYKKAAELGYANALEDQKRTAIIGKYWQDAHNGKSEAQYMLAICYASGNGIEKNEITARKWFKLSADKGYAKAQLALGIWLINGIGGERQIPLGIEYCEKSAKQNYSEAFNYLGKLFFDGKITDQNYSKAVLYYEKAVKAGSLDAIFNLAYCYQNGLGIEKNLIKAFELFKNASSKGFIPAAFSLAECYENGLGVDINYTLALKYYSSSAAKKWKNSIIKKSNIDAAKSKKRLSVIGKYWAAANKKDANAQYKVAVCYLQANGVKKDIKKAFDWFSVAAKQNNVDAIVMLAEYQLNGILVEKNEKAAFETFVQAVDKGSVAAMLRLGRCYEGGLGVEQNLTTAYMWYMKFAQKHPVTGKKEAQRIEKVANVWDKALKENNPEAQFLLAEYYSEDTPGLKKDLKKSFALYKKAAEQGYVEAMFKLTGCYAKGKGVDQDIPSAIDWCKKAADKNHGNALFEMGRLYQQGIAVTQNLTTAYDYFDKAEKAKFNRASQAKAEIKTIAQCWQNAYDGDAANQYKLAVCYFKGIGIEKNNTVAQQWLEKSAAQKYSEAQYDLAVIYMLDKSPEKIKQAFELLTQAAAKNHIKAMVKLGECYYNGLGVEDDYEKAIELWEKAIKENNSDAMYLLGVYRATGRGFFNSGKDWDKALDLWEKASALGHKDASYKLANYYKEEKEDFNKSLKYFAKAAKQGHLQAMYIYGEYAYKQGLQDEGIALIKYAAEKGNADAVKFVNEVNKSQKQSKPNPVRQSSSTQENVSARNNRVNINGANIAVKQNAKVLAEKDAIIAIKNIFAEWTPEKFISADFIPIEGQADKFIASERISENRIKMTTYVLMEFDKNKFYQKFVPEISNVLNNIAIKKQRFNRRSSTTPIGGFWWGDYASRNQSSFKLDAKYFIPEKVLKYREFDRSLCLNTNYDNFTIYELPENVSISSIVRKYRNSKFVLSVELLDKDKNTVKTLERIVTAKSDYGQSYFPVFGTTYPYVDMLIAPEFNGINEVRIDSDAYQFFPQLVRKVEGYVTEDELKNIVSMKISFEIK